MWAAAIVILLPALAWLQYSWLDQIAVADRDRRERTVRTAATQLAQEFDLELSKAFFALQVDTTMVEPRGWPAYATRYAAWSTSAANPRMIQGVYLASGPPSTATPKRPLTLQRWDPAAQRFETIDWPAEMEAVSTRVRDQLDQMSRRGMFRRGDGPPPGPMPPDDPSTMIAPIVQVSVDEQQSDKPPRSPEVRVIGFTLVRIDLEVLKSEMLPTFVRRHFFDESGHADFRVAVVKGDDDQNVLFESEPGAAAAALDRPDATTPLMSAHGRPLVMFSRGDRATGLTFTRGYNQPMPMPPPPDDRMVVNILEHRRKDGSGEASVQARMLANSDGQWRLVAKHRAGSLEAAVSTARTRNFALSSGILLLLSAAIGLIIVSARRADRLGRQQMEFVATVSHELRTPVTVIGAAAGNLADGVVSDPTRVKHYGETIQTEARRLTETVERVLQLAGIASGRTVASESLAPAALVDEALEGCRTEIDAAGFTVELDVPGYLPLVMGDRTALRSALQNLIGNALKYGTTARWMRVSVHAISGMAHDRSNRSTRGTVEISVVDRGPGIPVEDRPHIFEAFYRGRQAVAHQIPGSGLGLHLVQRIAEAHGGQVTLDCESGPGCRFTMTLPAADSSTASEHSMSADVFDRDPVLQPGQSH
jgi:signal transduction histidine kinase